MAPARAVGHVHLRAYVFEVDDLVAGLQRVDQVVQLTLVDEPAGRKDGLHASGLAGRLQVPDPGGEVQHRRHPAKRVQGEEGHHHPGAGGQQHAHALAPFGKAGDLPPQCE
jgi:hypothetical protein